MDNFLYFIKAENLKIPEPNTAEKCETSISQMSSFSLSLFLLSFSVSALQRLCQSLHWRRTSLEKKNILNIFWNLELLAVCMTLWALPHFLAHVHSPCNNKDERAVSAFWYEAECGLFAITYFSKVWSRRFLKHNFENFKLCTAKDKKNVYKKTCFPFFLRLLSIPSSDTLRSVFLFIHYTT